MASLTELEKIITTLIIQEDVETIYSLLKSETDPIFSMEIVPYYALFVQSFQELVGSNFFSDSMATRIKDIRNHIKIYSKSFSKSQKRVLDIDDTQNYEFESLLKLESLKNKNIHFNLGAYWTDDRKIVGNTQQISDFLEIKHFDENVVKRQYELCCEVRSFVNSVRAGISQKIPLPQISRKNKSISVQKYCDINTNVDNELFANGYQKELNLLFLHLLCNMNFVKHILCELFEEGNIWVFRVEYIVTYYTYYALKRLNNYCSNNNCISIDKLKIKKILEMGNMLFKPKFRNCMMHYNLVNQGVILPENIEKHFYGIVETCFNGIDFYTYLSNLRELSDEIIRFLESNFNFSKVQLKNL